MKKILVSGIAIVSFAAYAVFLKFGGFSPEFFNAHNKIIEPSSTDQNVANTTSTSTNNVTRQTNCVYIPADNEDAENYNDETGEDGNPLGHYKCTTIIVPVPSSTAPTPATPEKVKSPEVTNLPPPIIKPKNTVWKDGTFIGDSIDAYYGYVQVSVTTSGDKMTSINFLDYPQDRKTSLQKSNNAMPILKSEAITKQSANVNSVSGATYTSDAFVQSLTSALKQAKI